MSVTNQAFLHQINLPMDIHSDGVIVIKGVSRKLCSPVGTCPLEVQMSGSNHQVTLHVLNQKLSNFYDIILGYDCMCQHACVIDSDEKIFHVKLKNLKIPIKTSDNVDQSEYI